MLYSEKVMDHFQNPRNVGKMKDASGVGEVGNARCGDIMRMYIKVEDGIITDVKFNTSGCGSAIASSSMATEMIKGKPVSEALELSNKAVVEALDGLPPQKIHCSVLAEEAVKAAVKDYYDKEWELPIIRPIFAAMTVQIAIVKCAEIPIPLWTSRGEFAMIETKHLSSVQAG